MQNIHVAGELLEALAQTGSAQARFERMTAVLSKVGIDQVNYGYFDPKAASIADASLLFVSNMSPGWLEYYADRGLHLADPIADPIRQGSISPFRWSDESIDRLEDDRMIGVAHVIREAGLETALCVPMIGLYGGMQPVAGMTLGSSLKADELARVTAGLEPILIGAAQIFHQLGYGPLSMERLGAGALTPRERDCLTLLAKGLRPDRIADRLGLAKVTVDMHLRGARQRMKARTLAEAVARAVVARQIDIL